MITKSQHFDGYRRPICQPVRLSPERSVNRCHSKKRYYCAYLAPEEALFFQLMALESAIKNGVKALIKRLFH